MKKKLFKKIMPIYLPSTYSEKIFQFFHHRRKFLRIKIVKIIFVQIIVSKIIEIHYLVIILQNKF